MTSANSSNLAAKFSPKVQESFKTLALTNNAINRDYDFIGVNTVEIYHIKTSAMNSYDRGGSVSGRSGIGRYGAVSDLGSTKETLILRNDRSFTFSIDKKDNAEMMGVLNPGTALKRQIEYVVVPEIDKYRFGAIVNEVDSEGGYKVSKEISKNNAYECLLDGVTKMLNDGVPMAGAVVYISPYFYKQIRLDPSFIKSSDVAQNMLIKGQVGEIDGLPLVLVPDSYFPSQTNGTQEKWSHLNKIDTLVPTSDRIEFMISNKAAVVGAENLIDYKVHDNPPGINGWLIEGRICYDAFVLKEKKHMIYVHTQTESNRTAGLPK